MYPFGSSHLTRRSCILLQIACCSCLTLLGSCAGLRGRGLELTLVLDGGDVDYGEVNGEYGVRKVKIFWWRNLADINSQADDDGDRDNENWRKVL